MDLIIGAGITGLSYAAYTNNDYIVIEKDDQVGGYCRTIKQDGFVWDYSGHFFHFQDQAIKNLIFSGINADDVLTVTKRSMNTSLALRQTLEILDRYHAPVEHITLGLDSFALVSSTKALGDSVYDVIADIQKTVSPDDVNVKEGISLVATVGRKMTSRPGTSGRLFHALGKNGINIRTIAQGADELSIIVGVENADFEKAIRVIYERFAG